jgi:hypothetical protein
MTSDGTANDKTAAIATAERAMRPVAADKSARSGFIMIQMLAASR